MNNEIQRRQEKKKTDRETYSERVKEKPGGGKPAENEAKDINHPQQTDREHQRDLCVKEER